jgi:hypothetical protein
MAAALLTTASVLQCPHLGTVTIATTNTLVQGGGVPIVLVSDTFTIVGCPFQIPVGVGTVPHPCVRVQWIKPNLLTTVNGVPTLAADSVGLCLAADQVPQGQVAVVMTQPGISGG